MKKLLEWIAMIVCGVIAIGIFLVGIYAMWKHG
jgi:hypothetical protein